MTDEEIDKLMEVSRNDEWINPVSFRAVVTELRQRKVEPDESLASRAFVLGFVAGAGTCTREQILAAWEGHKHKLAPPSPELLATAQAIVFIRQRPSLVHILAESFAASGDRVDRAEALRIFVLDAFSDSERREFAAFGPVRWDGVLTAFVEKERHGKEPLR